MDRQRAIDALKTLAANEARLAQAERPYLDKASQRRAEQAHWNYHAALQYAISELESFHTVRHTEQCPTPRQELDEFVCTKCRIRWDIKEERPPCRT